MQKVARVDVGNQFNMIAYNKHQSPEPSVQLCRIHESCVIIK